MTEYWKMEVSEDILELSRQAINEGLENDWEMEKIVYHFVELVEEHTDNIVLNEEEINAAFEQASYILDFEEGYVEERNYPVKQEKSHN